MFKTISPNIQYLEMRSDGRYVCLREDCDYWFRTAKELKSLDRFIIASVLSSMDVWELIGVPNEENLYS